MYKRTLKQFLYSRSAFKNTQNYLFSIYLQVIARGQIQYTKTHPNMKFVASPFPINEEHLVSEIGEYVNLTTGAFDLPFEIKPTLSPNAKVNFSLLY